MRQRDSFEISGPDNVVFGRGTVASIGERAAALGDRVLVVTDPGIRGLGLLDDVLDSFDERSLDVAVFEDVTPDPTTDVVRSCAAQASERNVDVVVGVGGGSSMDVAKAAALLARSEKPLEQLYGRDRVDGAGLPTILVPTTSGTGSEVSPAIVLYDEGEKRAVISDEAFADTALVDPALTMHLPLELTRSTGLDAFSHAIGSYVSTTSNAYADALTVEAMELIETHLRDATFHGADAPIAREQMSLAAMLAMLGRVNGGKAAIHSFAYGLQEMYDLPHGEAIAMVLPEVIEYNLPAAVEKLALLGTRIYDADGPDRERAQAVVDGLYRLRSDLGLDRSLGSVGSPDDLDRLTEYAMHSERHLRANPRDVTERDARTLLERLF